MELDWLWSLARWTLLAAGVALILYALFWDRARGRKRCPKCWYDMAGVPFTTDESGATWVCPECGNVAKTKGALTKVRRRWKLIALSLALIGASHTVYLWRHVKSRGWPAAVPDVLLVCVVDPEEFYSYRTVSQFSEIKYSLREELNSRVLAERDAIRQLNPNAFHERTDTGDGTATSAMSRWAAWIWLQRVERCLSKPHHAMPRAVVRTYSLGPFVRRARAFDPRAILPLPTHEIVYDTLSLLTHSVYPNEWTDNGGVLIRREMVRDWLVVKTDEQAHAKIAAFLEKLERAAKATPPCVDAPPNGYGRTPPWLQLPE